MNAKYCLLLAALMLSSCASHKAVKIPDTLELKNPAPEQKAEAPVEHAEPKVELEGLDTRQPYSLSVKDAELKDVLQLLSRKTGMPIITDKEVNGRVTVELKDKTVRDILFSLLTPLGYSAYMEHGMIRIGKPQLISRMFSLNYIKDKRTSSSTMNASITESNSSGNTQSAGESAGSSSQQAGSVSVKTSGVSDFWNEVIKGLEIIVFGEAVGSPKTDGYAKGDKSGRQLIINELAGVVYIRDYPANMENIQAYLDNIDKSVKRQVLIQANIVEVTLNDSYSLGINWSALLNSGIGSDLRPMTLSQNVIQSQSNVFNISVTNSKVTALLDAMKEIGAVKVLSSPKISTLNNQKAIIKLTTQDVSWSSVITNATAQSPGYTSFTAQQVDYGIFLDVTPQISGQGKITMQIHPSISDKLKDSIAPDKTSGSKPVITVREVDSLISVNNNQTIVIAGLIQDKRSETKVSVPFLSDIPLIGRLFSYISRQKSKTELVILITPYILEDDTIAKIRLEQEDSMANAPKKFNAVP